MSSCENLRLIKSYEIIWVSKSIIWSYQPLWTSPESFCLKYYMADGFRCQYSTRINQYTSILVKCFKRNMLKILANLSVMEIKQQALVPLLLVSLNHCKADAVLAVCSYTELAWSVAAHVKWSLLLISFVLHRESKFFSQCLSERMFTLIFSTWNCFIYCPVIN